MTCDRLAFAVVFLAFVGAAEAQPSVWQLRNSGTTAGLYGAAYGPLGSSGSIFFAVGQGGTATVSSDGANWSATALGGPTLFDIDTNGSGCFMATGGDGLVRAFGPCSGVDYAENILWSGVAYGGGTWSVVGGWLTPPIVWRNVYIRSTNAGASWTSVDEPSGTLQTPLDTAYGNGFFMCGLGTGEIKRSTDGVSYATVADTPQSVQALAYGNSTWIAVGHAGQICRSTNNGTSWSVSTVAGNPLLATVTFGGGYFVIGGQNGLILYSTNGASWTQAPSPVPGQLLEGSAYGNGTWILTSETGAIVQSSILPDLAPVIPSGWSAPIVTSRAAGTTMDDPLDTTDSIFVDLAWANLGRGASTAFVVELRLDGVPLGTVNSPALPVNTFVGATDIVTLPPQTAGSHMLQMVVDSTSVVAEANEANIYTKTFEVTTPPCASDLDDGTGTGTPDGGVDINDLLYFLAEFEAGSDTVDLDDGSGTGTPDGGTDINDLLYFLAHFEVGC